MQDRTEKQDVITGLSSWFYKISSGWVVLLAMVIFLFFSIVVLPAQASKAEVYSKGIGSPDLSFYYSPTKIYQIVERFGASGRYEYVRTRFTFDLIFPLIYGGFLVTAISWLYARILNKKDRRGLINLIPLGGVIFDYLENISVSVVMLRFPQPATLAGSLAGIFTALKWTLMGVSLVVLVMGVLFVLINYFRGPRTGPGFNI